MGTYQRERSFRPTFAANLYGRLRFRATFYTAAETRNPASGAVERVWLPVPGLVGVPADFRGISGRVWMQNQQPQRDVTCSIAVREDPRILEDMRVVVTGKAGVRRVHVILPDGAVDRLYLLMCGDTSDVVSAPGARPLITTSGDNLVTTNGDRVVAMGV